MLTWTPRGDTRLAMDPGKPSAVDAGTKAKTMTETEFNQLVDDTLMRIEAALDASGADIDFETAQGILTLTFPDGSKIIINRQGANQELWVAARAGGFHYRWQDGAWRNTRDGSELMASLSRWVSEQAGEPIELT
jgi:CyaY protein